METRFARGIRLERVKLITKRPFDDFAVSEKFDRVLQRCRLAQYDDGVRVYVVRASYCFHLEASVEVECMRASVQRPDLSDDLATHIYPGSAVVADRLSVSAYAVSDRRAHIDASGIPLRKKKNERKKEKKNFIPKKK